MERKILWKIEMIRKGISQKQMATELGISAAHFNSIMSGRRKSDRAVDYTETRLGLRSRPEIKKK